MTKAASRVLKCTLLAAVAALAAGCAHLAPAATRNPYAPISEAQYTRLYPYYAEICALSELEKKPGFGADIYSGIGGHEVLYLNGACRRKDTAYPVLGLCDQAAQQPAGDGVGLSSNAHYSNAVWAAIEGRDFFFTGGVDVSRTLDRETYRAVQAQAASKGLYSAITFHDSVFDGMPTGFTRSTFKYEISVATDYAIAFGRNRYCGRIPLDRAQMLRVIVFLNRLNEPYREGQKIFDWNILTHNCAHVNHNALSAAGIWDEWVMDRFILFAMFDFPVPKNEFVNLLHRTNDLPIDDLDALYDDEGSRRLLMQEGRLPTQPGSLADFGAVIPHNDLYETDTRIIFYDEPITGRYRQRFRAILAQPRYFRLRDNLLYFSALYAKIAAERKPVEWHLRRHWAMSAARQADFRIFYLRYYNYVDAQSQEVHRDLEAIGNL